MSCTVLDVIDVVAAPAFPLTTTIVCIALGAFGLWLGILNKLGRLKMPWASGMAESRVPIRFVNSLIPSSVGVLSLVAILSSAYLAGSKTSSLSLLGWILLVISISICAVSLVTLSVSLFGTAPRFLLSKDNKDGAGFT